MHCEPKKVSLRQREVPEIARLRIPGDRYRVIHSILNLRADQRDDDDGRYRRLAVHYRRFVARAVESGELPSDLDQPLFTEMIRDVWQKNLQNWVLKRRPKSP